MKIISYVPTFNLDVFQIIIDVLSLVVNAYVFNQSRMHWLFCDALHVTLTMALDNVKNNLE